MNKKFHYPQGAKQLTFYDLIIDDSQNEVMPYKYSITSYGADYPVDSLVNRLNNDSIIIPDFQRSYVWNILQASRFIESLILGLPVPSIFFSREPDSQKLLVIDGQQRLKSLQYFYLGYFKTKGKEFQLKGVQKNLLDKTYSTLDPEDKIRLNDSIIHSIIVKQDEPSDDESSIYHIFERLNTGGNILQPQEIRSCIYHGSFNSLLNDLNRNANWRKIYGPISKRLKDQELILRFLSLYFNYSSYEKPLKSFLNKFMAANREFLLISPEDMSKAFINTIDFIYYSIGKKAFRVKQVMVAGVFDSIMVGLSRRLSKGEIRNREEFAIKYNKLLTNSRYINYCKSGTSDENSVNHRIELTTKEFENLE